MSDQGPPGNINPHTAQRTIITSVRFHVQQWVNLVLYNSIYQNLILLYLYRIFKLIYGFFDRSTELSRICASSSPLDQLIFLHDIPPSNEHASNSHHRSTVITGTSNGRISTDSVSSRASTNSNANGSAISEKQKLLTQRQRTSSSAGTTAGSLTESSLSVSTAVELHPSTNALTSIQGDSASTLVSSTVATTTTTTTTTTTNNHHVHSTEHDSDDASSSTSPGSSSSSPDAARQGKSRQISAHDVQTKFDMRQRRAVAGMVYRIDRCVLFSKQLTVERRELEAPECDLTQITHQILQKKRFPVLGSPTSSAAKKLQYALSRIASTHQLAGEINQRVHTKFDTTNVVHERKLLLLWDMLCPDEKLESRYTKQWIEIGFQGKDPATDFRGMGMLGLDDLVYYVKHYPISSKHALECSHDEVSWYSFAIVGINITAFAVQILRTRQLQYYLFLFGTERSVYHELYCYLFHCFNSYWTTLEPRPSIMDFERLFAEFKATIEKQLMKRRPLMLKYDTKEVVIPGQQQRSVHAHGHGHGHGHGNKHSGLSSGKAEAIELETRKTK
ncbi:hypothetical protein BGW38_001165 [Lunasporangiospora selenospora]|uniref:ELMO domain-containing protein n=1 Tax=Lunasporangiospora selenospora TaxID=979761 RepID=A0A9P6FV11_9FUNG|nr:hypothetical protein BGW38_001165 [Lunasporangiospora selenospora]